MNSNEIRKTKTRSARTKKEGGLDTWDTVIEQRGEPINDSSPSLDFNRDYREVHEPSDAEVSGSCSSDAGGAVPIDGRDNRSMGDNQSSGCESDSSGLRPSLGAGQIVANVETNLHDGGDVPLRTGLGIGSQLQAPIKQRGTVTVRNNQHSNINIKPRIQHRLPSSPVGVDEVCMDAMKVIGCISAIIECMDAIEYDELDEFLTDASARFNTFVKNSYIYLTSPEVLGDKGGERGQAPRSEAESLS